jgi:zinc transport system substrate-binding protein
MPDIAALSGAGGRFPFRCFADEYGLDCCAAFIGGGSETEVSASIVAELINKVRSEQLPAVFKVELSVGITYPELMH